MSGYDPNQPRGPHTGEWIDTPGGMPDLPNPSGPFGGSREAAATTYWNEQGCGEFAMALKETFPKLNLAGAEMGGGFGHVWAYDDQGTRYDIFGSTPSAGTQLTSDEKRVPDVTVKTDISPAEIEEGLGFKFSRKNIDEARGIVLEMFGGEFKDRFARALGGRPR